MGVYETRTCMYFHFSRWDEMKGAMPLWGWSALFNHIPSRQCSNIERTETWYFSENLSRSAFETARQAATSIKLHALTIALRPSLMHDFINIVSGNNSIPSWITFDVIRQVHNCTLQTFEQFGALIHDLRIHSLSLSSTLSLIHSFLSSTLFSHLHVHCCTKGNSSNCLLFK